MAWKIPELKSAFDEGDTGKNSHMLVAYDNYDYEDYAIYVPRGENPHSYRPKNGDRVMECYRYDLSWESQAAEYRANHWEYELQTPSSIAGAN